MRQSKQLFIISTCSYLYYCINSIKLKKAFFVLWYKIIHYMFKPIKNLIIVTKIISFSLNCY